MEILPKLTPAQSLLLRTAARRPDGRVIPPDTLRGGARVKVLTALLQRGWIEPADGGHLLTDAGYAAIVQERPVRPDDVQSVDTIGDLQLLDGIPVRPGTKLAALVIALRRPQGATSLQLTWYHKAVGQRVLLALVVLHLLAIAYYIWRGRTLVRPMIGGDHAFDAAREVPAAADGAGRRLLAAALVAACAGGVAWLVSLGS